MRGVHAFRLSRGALAVLAAAALCAALPSRGDGGRAAAAAPAAPKAGAPSGPAAERLPTIAILCYHDVTDDPDARLDAVPPDTLRAHIRRARANGWTFVRLSELIAARERPWTLPPRTMVLTFDDGYRSFATHVVPILREERVPAAVAIVDAFVEHPPADAPPVMSWPEIAAVAREDLVEIASHSHGLHEWAQGDPFGGTSPAATTRLYLAA